MPRGRGGRRNGRQGQAYPNRSDLNKQPVRVATGQTYGQAGQQAAAQQAVPLPAQRPVQAQGSPIEALLTAAPPVDAPTNRPNEPLTAGLPTGGGPGPEAIQQFDEFDVVLRELYRVAPNNDLLELIEMHQRRRGAF